jgi:catecholate siderophore receptor
LNVATEAPSSYRRDNQPAARLPTAIADTPPSISIVLRKLIAERGGTTLRGALQNVTGISLAAGEGGVSGDDLTLRGFGARGDLPVGHSSPTELTAVYHNPQRRWADA